MQEVILARIERAKFYLTTTDMSIKSLSDFCGYENELHFVRQYKAKEGLTPSQYRKLFTPKL
jgi:AraC family transcriptional regulator of arabinose operon